MDVINKNFNEILNHFKIDGYFIDAKPFGNGHINETMLVSFREGDIIKEYILRRLNNHVFKDPQIVVSNTVNATDYIAQKLRKEGKKDIPNQVLELIETKDSKYSYIDGNGDYWCLVVFIKNAYTVEHVETSEQAYQAAKAFGHFQMLLIDADINSYKESIQNFHNLESRLASFDVAVKENLVGRVNSVEKEIDLVNSYRSLSNKITNLINNSELPIRITHNDTKINNVMLNKVTNEGQCVIDLDTVMPGTVLYDFGDMVRTSTSPVEEDEPDVSKVIMRLDIFNALVKGYLEELADVLTEIEISNLVYGAKVIVYEQAIRFLTDYIMNDVYYNTDFTEHNLVRTRTQLALLESIDNQTKEMENIVKKYTALNLKNIINKNLC
ncbi:MAG: phosphotransferase [Bacteroidota bacterium]